MFSLLVFLFKLFFSTFFSVLFSYFIAEEEENNLGVVLFAILGVLISYLSMSSSDMYSGVSIAILASFIIALSYCFFDVSNNNEKLLFVFPGLIGLMIGFSLVVESIFIIGFLYIAKNSLNYIYDSDDDNAEKVENQENIK
tara:strand:- start:397 stop:819 length:423 start_codon:yes stop_codon:yes gene_type:complete